MKEGDGRRERGSERGSEGASEGARERADRSGALRSGRASERVAHFSLRRFRQIYPTVDRRRSLSHRVWRRWAEGFGARFRVYERTQTKFLSSVRQTDGVPRSPQMVVAVGNFVTRPVGQRFDLKRV